MKTKQINAAKLYLLGEQNFTNALTLIKDKAYSLKYNTEKNRKIINEYAHEILNKPIDCENFIVNEICCSDKSNTPDVINDNALALDVCIMLKPKMEVCQLNYVIK